MREWPRALRAGVAAWARSATRLASTEAGGPGQPAPSRRAHAALFVVFSVGLVTAALVILPRPWGDGSEYQLMAESWLRHGSPELRASDVVSLAARERRCRTGADPGLATLRYYEARDGRWYCYHFWGYSLCGVPLKGVLRLARANDLRALPLLNALVFVFALHQTLWASRLPAGTALSLASLAAASPALWFVPWVHPEAFCFALVLLALVWAHAGRRLRPIVAAALAAAQNGPIVWLLVPLVARALGSPWPPTRRRLGGVTLALAPFTLPPLFNLWKFGTLSLLARLAADVGRASWQRVGELFFDLNLGMAVYVPVPFALALAGVAAGRWTMRRLVVASIGAGVLLAMAYSATVTVNWNHGTAGPSRYTVWMLPLVLWAAAHTCGALLHDPRPGRRQLGAAALGLALASQAALIAARGGLVQGDDSMRHSWAARWVLHHAPAWYRPPAEIFLPRTLGMPVAGDRVRAVYRDAGGCRKAWLRPKDADWLRVQCGAPPAPAAAFLERRERRKQWGYVDY